MKPGTDAWKQPQIRERDGARPDFDVREGDALVALAEPQRLLLAALQGHEHGMTVRQLEATLSWPKGGAQPVLDALLARQVVARLNTVIPSYKYRYGGVDLDAD